ncbi:hypothetical protein HYX70_01800 [Candidatus Saccharibacteria bacterium]|nr:hypothetical protein [Candidatus Saccharibacteria bacterium]
MPADLVVITEADWTEDRVDYFDELQEGLHDELRDTFAIWDESPLKLESHLVIVGMPPQAGPHGVLPRLPDKDSTLTVPETARLEHWRGLSGP